MIIFKLLLVALSVLLSTLTAKRFGHRIGGVLSGMPMIAGPIMAVLLVDQPVPTVRAIALGTLVCVPAGIAHIVAFAHASQRRFRWLPGLATALAVFLLLGTLLMQLALPSWLVVALALVSPGIGLVVAPHVAHSDTPVHVPVSEFVLRMTAAMGMAAVIIATAGIASAGVSGLLLAVPITGSVLPCFTLPRYGFEASVQLLRGFVQGLHGFVTFFVALYVSLGLLAPLPAFVVSAACAVGAALAVQWLRQRNADDVLLPADASASQ